VKRIPLEDNFNDIIGKAQRGLQVSDEQLSRKAGVPVEAISKSRAGQFDEAVVSKLAPVLKLGVEALVASGKQSWYPQDLGSFDGLAAFNMPYGDITVNSFLIWDPTSNNGAVFDTGADASEMLKLAADHKIRVQMILLTHTHPDHVADLARLKRVTQAASFDGNPIAASSVGVKHA